MGAHYRELWVQVRDAAALPAARRAHPRLDAATPGVFVCVDEADFDPAGPDDAGLEAISRHGEAVHLAVYDGAAGELCGAFEYVRARGGEVVRALVCVQEDDGTTRWTRVDGKPEGWERRFVEVYLHRALVAWADDADVDLDDQADDQGHGQLPPDVVRDAERFVVGGRALYDADDLAEAVRSAVLGPEEEPEDDEPDDEGA